MKDFSLRIIGNDPAIVCMPQDLEMVCLLETHGIPNKPPDDNLQSGLKKKLLKFLVTIKISWGKNCIHNNYFG